MNEYNPPTGNKPVVYAVEPVIKTTSPQRPPVLNDRFCTTHYVNSTTVKDLCTETIIPQRPPIPGPLGGLYTQVSLYMGCVTIQHVNTQNSVNRVPRDLDDSPRGAGGR